MKKKNIIGLIAIILTLAISCEVETNYPENLEGHYGKVILHNEQGSGKNITYIRITHSVYGKYEDIYKVSYGYGSDGDNNISYSFAPGRSYDYNLGLKLGAYNTLYNKFSITVTLDDSTTKSCNISAYEDIVNNVYLTSTDLVERK